MKIKLTLILVAIFYYGGISYSQNDRGNFIPANNEPVEIDFEVLSGLIVIEAEINGVSGKFIFDNGASLSVIKQGFADKAHVKFDGFSNIRDANNRTSTIPKGTVDKVAIGNQIFQGTGFFQTETEVFMPCNEIDGFIGASIINKANWRINFEEKKIHISSTPFRANGKKLPISISDNNSSFATISILGVSYKCKIDLGSNGSIKINKKYSDNSFEGLLAEKRIGTMSLSANGLGKTDTIYHLYDKLPIINSGDTLQAHASIMIKDKLKHQGYIGLNYFYNYGELLINSTEREYILVNSKEYLQNKVDSSFGLDIYPIDNVWKIIQIDSYDSTLSEIELMDEVLMIDNIPMEQFKNICDYIKYLKIKIDKEESLVISIKDSLTLELPFRRNKIHEIPVYNKK